MSKSPLARPEPNAVLNLLLHVEVLQSKNRQHVRSKTAELLEALPRAHRASVTSAPPCFNVLDLCGVGADERRHSGILAWLLDEMESHGQGNKFFQAFTTLCGLRSTTTHIGYTVRTEFPGFESITDIIAFRPGDFFVSVENKVFAEEGHKQLDREYRDLQRYAESLGVPRGRRVAVFLTPAGRKPQSGDPSKWRSLSYSQLAAALTAPLSQISSHKLQCFLADWFSILRNFNPVHLC